MEDAPRVRLEADEAVRARHILAQYGDIASDRDALLTAIDRLPSHHSKARKAEWKALAAAGDLEPLVAGLIADHYDPAYARSMGRRAGDLLGTVALSGDCSLEAAARSVARLAAETEGPVHG
jgi:tRNA 2-selenouridine synthase